MPRYDEGAEVALPPLVLDPGRALAEPRDRQAGGRAARPFRIAAEPFVPRTSFEVHAGAAERLALIVWDPEAPGDPAADVEVRSSLTSRDGHPVPPCRLTVEAVHRDPGGRRTFVFRYTREPVEAGDYTLRIGLDEGGRSAEAYTTLRVRTGS